MKASEIRNFSDDEIQQKEQELAKELVNLKFQHSSGQLQNTMRILQVKRDLARIKTILREKALGLGKEG
jgi:large subunit ribosomal protein L29